MTRRYLLIWLAAILASCAAHAAAPGQHPNILFILIDDMGYGDLSCYGNRELKTRALDGLAKEGIRFSQFYVSAPLCSPSRVAFTTGQYPNRWRITSYLDDRKTDRDRGLADWLDPRAPSLARILAHAGYYTAHVGKWHMGGQRDIGESPLISEYGFADSLTNFEGLGERVLPKFEPMNNGKPLEHRPTQMSADLGGGPIHWVPRHRVTEFYVDRAIEEIKKANTLHQPFYINLWPDDVHSPVEPPPELRGDNSRHDGYLGVVKELDRQLGRVFDFIRYDPQLKDNTIIVVASDNGPEEGLGSTGGLRGGKGNLYEGGIREPLIVWSNLIAPAAKGWTDDLSIVAGMDLPPTLLSLVNVSATASIHFDGMDVSDAFLGHPIRHRNQPIVWTRPPDRPGLNHAWPDLVIRDGKWKLLTYREPEHDELFDIASDSGESGNVADSHPQVVANLKHMLSDWENRIKATSSPSARP